MELVPGFIRLQPIMTVSENEDCFYDKNEF